MTDPKVGDIVFVTQDSRVYRKLAITKLKQYKRRLKVVTSDGSEWDWWGRAQWSSRTQTWYSGPRLEPYSEATDAAFKRHVHENRLNWAYRNIDLLSDEQLARIGNVIKEAQEKLTDAYGYDVENAR